MDVIFTSRLGVSSIAAGTSATQPAIAANERMPPGTAAAHNTSTTATG